MNGRCTLCDADRLLPILDLGRLPLANALLKAPQADPRFPLALVFCPACTLLQLESSVPPEELFTEYLYLSSFSAAFVAHARALAERTIARRELHAGSLVMEVASNDGYLLQHYVQRGIPVLGIDPARNLAPIARERGVETLTAFFGREVAATLAAQGKLADVLHANNVMAHVPDLDGFMAGIARVLAPTGLALIEAPYVKDLIDHVEFDTIYHEHVSYFSLTAVQTLAARHGLLVVDVEHLPVHGGTLRYHLAHTGPASPRVTALLAEEAAWGVADPAFYLGFAEGVAGVCSALKALLQDLKRAGASIAAYGASAKGTTLLNTAGIGAETLDYVVDRSTVKQGLFTPGTHLPILPVERLMEGPKPDVVLLLAWNFADEILAQQAAYREAGGRFVVPIPTPRVC